MLVKCRECKLSISHTATACSHCGCVNPVKVYPCLYCDTLVDIVENGSSPCPHCGHEKSKRTYSLVLLAQIVVAGTVVILLEMI